MEYRKFKRKFERYGEKIGYQFKPRFIRRAYFDVEQRDINVYSDGRSNALGIIVSLRLLMPWSEFTFHKTEGKMRKLYERGYMYEYLRLSLRENKINLGYIFLT